MSLPRVSLLLAALGSGGLGIAFLVTPEKLIRQVDLALVGPGGLSEIWAMYGGLELGLAGFFIACAVRQRWARAGLAAQFLSFGGLATGRLAGILQHGPGGRLMLLSLLVEVALAILGVVAFNRARTRMLNHRIG